MKPVVWVENSREAIRNFSDSARQEAGYQLERLQRGQQPKDWKSMPSVGLGVHEIRVHSEREYRVIYVAKFEEAVYVLHAFVKKTRQTAKHDLDLAGVRYRALLNQRKAK